VTTCGCWPGADLADALVTDLLTAAGVPTTDRLPEGVRVAARDGYTWATNFTDRRHTVEAPDAAWVVGGPDLGGYDAAVVAADPTGAVAIHPLDDSKSLSYAISPESRNLVIQPLNSKTHRLRFLQLSSGPGQISFRILERCQKVMSY